MSKNQSKSFCVNNECKSNKNLNANNALSYAQCSNCGNYEHFRCAKVEAHIKTSYQNGRVTYICTECLKKDPVLALKMAERDVSQRAITQNSVEDDSEASGVAKDIVE